MQFWIQFRCNSDTSFCYPAGMPGTVNADPEAGPAKWMGQKGETEMNLKQTGRLAVLVLFALLPVRLRGARGGTGVAAAGRLRWNPGTAEEGDERQFTALQGADGIAYGGAGGGRVLTLSTLKTRADGSSNLMYLDYASMRTAYLCARPAAPTTARTVPAMCLTRRAAPCPVSLAKTCCLSFRANCTARGTQPFCPTSSGWTLTAATARQSSPSKPTRCCASRS